MATEKLPESLQSLPSYLAERWLGYFHNTDETILAPNCLIYPSMNCFIPNKDKIVPRLGSVLLGQPATAGKIWPIIGHKERFATMSGIEVEVRVTKTDDTNLRDVIEALYPNPVTGVLTWYQVTENVNPLTPGVGKLGMRARYYFDDWFDTDLDPALSLNLTRLIGVNGTTQVLSWTGGIAPIGAVVVNTSISTVGGVTWASLGFVAPTIGVIGYTVIAGTILLGDMVTGGISGATAKVTAVTVTGGVGVLNLDTITGIFEIGETITGTGSGTGSVTTFNEAQGSTGSIIVNGTAHAITGGWSTDTLTLSDTTGIAVNDVAISQIQTDVAPIAFDVCRQNKNYIFYGAWNSRSLYMSNGFGKDPTEEITDSAAVQNDLVVGTSNYTGVGQHTYTVTIDSVAPNSTDFAGSGSDSLIFDSSGYSGSGNNTYKVIIYQATTYSSGVNDFWFYYLVYKNGIQVGSATILQDILTGAPLPGPFAVTDGITFTIPEEIIGTLYPTGAGPYTSYTGYLNPGDSWSLAIGSADTFQYQVDGGTPVATMVPITGASQSLGDGITISFTNKTGHTLGDTWTITATQGVSKAWINFYYTLPTRVPGEGYIYRLPSNFWTMAPQEEQMYVNTTYGYWSYVDTVLSSDLQSETVSLTPLKQASSSKVIFPYMIDYLDDDLIYITDNKTLDTIGRKVLLQLPQTSNLSQPVALDLQALGFVDGSMKYLSKRLNMTSPIEGAMLVYDNQPENKYWQPPQMIPGNGMLSILGNDLITHSNVQNQTLTLFTGNAGDNGAAYTFRARTAYNSYGDRWYPKNSSTAFTDGHVSGIPPLKHTVYCGVDGCGGIFPHDIVPKVCIAKTKAPLGEGSLGSHSFASDLLPEVGPYFAELFKDYSPILSYYFAAVEVSCTTTSHKYDFISLGLNAIFSSTGNNDLINEPEISRT